jgi:enoyl-CoA hydratase/carnithine racemase
MSELCTLDFADKGAIAVVTLNDPSTANAMSPEMGDAFGQVLESLKDESALRAVIVRGAGKNFSIGGHRDMLSKLTDPAMSAGARREFMLGYYARWLKIVDVSVPVIAAIEGECIGVAPVFAFVSDIALADETAHFEITFTNLGLYPGMALPKLVPDHIGRQRAALTILGAIPFSGAEAERLGVVARAVPAGTVHEAALALARRIAETAPATSRDMTKTLRVKREDIIAELEANADKQAQSYASEEFHQRIAKYLPDHYQT